MSDTTTGFPERNSVHLQLSAVPGTLVLIVESCHVVLVDKYTLVVDLIIKHGPVTEQSICPIKLCNKNNNKKKENQ